MKTPLAASIVAFLLGVSLCAVAQQGKPPADHVKRDIADHRTMAEAHANAARCLESGRPEKECHAQLQKECRDVAIGKYCGMRHRH
jgi:hypothetical protein